MGTKILKVIGGVVCFLVASLLVPVALACHAWAGLFVAFFPAVFSAYFVIIGCCLILKRNSTLSKNAKLLVCGILAVFIGAPILLDFQIRHERKILQARAQNFLSQSVPSLLVPDADGYVGENYVGVDEKPPNDILGYSRPLIERYAEKGRIRWSAVIQGEFAATSDEIWVGSGPKADAVLTNKEVRLYINERNAILSKEWKMGFWQSIEDWTEFKTSIPEFEEEDAPPKKAQLLALTNNISFLR